MAEQRDRLLGAAGLDQRLALELVEIGIVGLRRDQRVHLAEREAQIGVAVGRNRAGVARREAGVARRIAPQQGVRPLHEAEQLGAHEIVARLQLRRILLVPVGIVLGDLRERSETLGRHRVRLQVGIGPAGREQHLVGEPLEGVVHALGRLVGRLEEADAGAVGLLLLLTRIGEQRALDHALCTDHPDRRIAAHGAAPRRRRGGHGADPEQHGEDRRGLRIGELGTQLAQVAAGDVAGLVGHHADDLVRRLRVHQCAGVDEDALGVDDEGVEGAIVDDDDADVALAEAGRFEDRATA